MLEAQFKLFGLNLRTYSKTVFFYFFENDEIN